MRKGNTTLKAELCHRRATHANERVSRKLFFKMRDQRCSIGIGALAKSGTVTLELALHRVPTVVTYELSSIDLFIIKRFGIDLPFYCIVNILAKKEVFRELIRPPVHTDAIAQHLFSIATDARIRSECQAACAELKDLITTASPSMLIAETLCEIKKR